MTAFLQLLMVFTQVGSWSTLPFAVTVGDTVRVVRRIPAAEGVTVRLEPLVASDVVQPLTPPGWSYAEGTIEVVYTVTVFRPGRHELALPPVDLLSPDNRIETIPAGTVTIEVISVLPPEGPPPEAKPSLAPIPRVRRSLGPPILLPLAVVTLTALVIAYRRRRRPRPAPPDVLGEDVHLPVESWIAAGESRAVATVVALELRRSIAQAVPDAGEHLDTAKSDETILQGRGDAVTRDLVAVLRSLDRARFSPAAPADVHEVVDEAERAIRAFRASREEPA